MNTKKLISVMMLTAVLAMCAPFSALNAANVNFPVTVNVYTGTVTSGSETVRYVYVPTYLDGTVYNYGQNNHYSFVDEDAKTFYGAIYRSVAPEYQAIMPDSAYLSTNMNGFIVFATSDDFETIDAQEGAQAFADMLAGGDWSNIANVAAYFFPNSTPNGAPQSSNSTTNYSYFIETETVVEYVYLDGYLTPVSVIYTLYAKPAVTVVNQTLDVTAGVPTNIAFVTCPNPLRAWVENGVLHVSGLTAGETWSVYNAAGVCIYVGAGLAPAQNSGQSSGQPQGLPLQTHGLYIVKQGNNAVKAVY